MKCERCGHELDDTDLFCSKCGKAVFEEYMDLDEEEESREQIIEEIPQEPERKREPRKRKPEKKSPVWLIAGCVLLVCLLVGFAAFWMCCYVLGYANNVYVAFGTQLIN